jgi:hypothetical protein
MELNVDWDEKTEQRFFDSFFDLFDEEKFRECWIWHGKVDKGGYPRFWDCKSDINVRKLVYEQFYRVELQKYKRLYNICCENSCVNPYHLSLQYKEPFEKTIKRFFKFVIKGRKNSDCWRWRGSILPSGYATFSLNGEMFRAHRLSFEIHKHKIPDGLHVLHHCDFPECCNPQHLYLGDAAQNAKDKVDRQRQAKGEKHGLSKLKEYQVREILKSTETNRVLGKKYHVSELTIYDIKARKTWKYVTDE